MPPYGNGYGWGTPQGIPGYAGPMPNPVPSFVGGGFAPMRKDQDGHLQFSSTAFWTEMFGPQKSQSQYPYNYETEHGIYPDFLRGSTPLFSAVFITSLTATDLVPLERMLPLRPWTGETLSIEWDEWIFRDHLMDAAPEEVPFRTTTSSKRSFKVGFRRFNRGLRWELTGEHTEMGKLEVKMGMKQLRNAFLETACMDVIHALLTVQPKPSTRSMTRSSAQRYSWSDWENILRQNIDMWGILQKAPGNGALLIDRMKDSLRQRGVSTNNLLLYMCAGAARYIDQMHQQTPYAITGKTTPGPAFPGAPAVYESRYFHMEEGDEPWDPMFQEATLGSIVPMNDEHVMDVPIDHYRTHMRNVVINSAQISADVVITLDAALRACGLFDVPEAARRGTGTAGRPSFSAVDNVEHWPFAKNDVAEAFQDKYKTLYDLFNASPVILQKFVGALSNSTVLYHSFFRLFGAKAGPSSPPHPPKGKTAPPPSGVDAEAIFKAGKAMLAVTANTAKTVIDIAVPGLGTGAEYFTKIQEDSQRDPRDQTVLPRFDEVDKDFPSLFGWYVASEAIAGISIADILKSYRRASAKIAIEEESGDRLVVRSNAFNAFGVNVILKHDPITGDLAAQLTTARLKVESEKEIPTGKDAKAAAQALVALAQQAVATNRGATLLLLHSKFFQQQFAALADGADAAAVGAAITKVGVDLGKMAGAFGAVLAKVVMENYYEIDAWTLENIKTHLNAPVNSTAGRASGKRRHGSDSAEVQRILDITKTDAVLQNDWFESESAQVHSVLETESGRRGDSFGKEAVIWVIALDVLRSSMHYRDLAQDVLEASSSNSAVFSKPAELAAEWGVSEAFKLSNITSAFRDNIATLAVDLRDLLERHGGTGARPDFGSKPGGGALAPEEARDKLLAFLKSQNLDDSRVLNWCLANDLPFPLAFNLWRMARFTMGSCLMLVPDGGTGYTFIANADARRGVDSVTKTASLNCTIYAKSVVMKEDCVVRQENIFSRAYNGGYGHGLYDALADAESIKQGEILPGRDILVTIADIHWRPSTFWVDSTGKPNSRLVDLSKSPYEAEDAVMYPFAREYSALFGFSHEEQSGEGTEFHATGSSMLNTLYFLDHYKGFKHTGNGNGTFDLVHTNKGPWGPNIYPGVDQVWRGGAVMMKPTNYNDQPIVSLTV